MEIDLNDIVNRILQTKNDFQGITIRGKPFKKDTKKNGHILTKEVYHLTLHYEKDGHNYEKSFFLDVRYNNPRYDELKQLNIFSAERKMYTDLFPQYERLLPSDSLHPEFYGTDGHDVLILEDLSLSGWKRAENRQLCFKEFALALGQLAKFHALGVKVHESQPQIVDDLQSIRAPPIFNSFVSTATQKSALAIRFGKIVDGADATFAKEHPEVLLYFENYLQQMSENSFELDEKFKVLSHGNICAKNIWFVYNELGEATAVKFTNFRNCHWGTPITDIIFFIITSMPFEDFEKNVDNLVEIYTTSLNATLEKLNCDQRLSVDELQGSIDSNYEYFLYFLVAVAVGCKKATQSEPDKIPPTECVEKESVSQLYKLWMRHFIRKGIFSQHEDLAIAIYTFIGTFEAENQTSVFRYYLNRKILKPGSNFTSLIVRLSFEYRDREENTYGSVLIKIPSLSVNYNGMKDMNMYDHEIFVYQKLLPELNKLWDGESFAPVCHTVSEAKIMVLEDLAVRGFRLCDKKQQLDLDHCRIALANLARYHAVTLKYLQRCDPATYNQLRNPVRISSSLRSQYKMLFSRFLKVLKPLVADSIYQKIDHLKDKLPFDTSFEGGIDDSGLNVIGHCDYWTNNILFRYDEDGHVCSLKMVDWQLARLASPVVDLIFFFVTSVRFEIFETYKDALLNFYLDTLSDTLSKLELNLVYLRTDLDEAMRRYKYYFWHYTATELPFMMSDEDSIDDELDSNVSELYLSATLKWVNYLEKENLI